jgi:para-aminobenzoate synthetase component I
MLRTFIPSVSDHPVFMLLETQKPYHGCSFLAAKPQKILTISQDTVRLEREDGSVQTWHENAWDALKRVRSDYPGWWFCALSYDLKNQDETLQSDNPDPVGLPELIAFQPGVLMREDADGSISYLSSHPKLDQISDEFHPFAISALTSSTHSMAYHSTIQAIKKDIFEGEYYELNLSHQIKASYSGDGPSLFEAMAQKGPVPMAAYLKHHQTEVICASPERYLKRTGTKIISEPIKGTRPRSSDPKQDQQIREELLRSEKERAENLMIVDLVRNDLSRIARPGSVLVEQLFEIRSYATVHQMVSTVTAQVEVTTDPIDIIRNTFPMGSMTGAPKRRVMQAIETYENYKRGLYSGALGYITPNGDFDFNVVIRTAILNDGHLFYSVGGAITSDSDPQAEWEETWVKSRALPI